MIADFGLRIRNLPELPEPTIRSKTKNQRPKTKDQKPKTKNQRPKTKDLFPLQFLANEFYQVGDFCGG
jgi:hypothetical protein